MESCLSKQFLSICDFFHHHVFVRFSSHFSRQELKLECIMVKWVIKLARSHTGFPPFPLMVLSTSYSGCLQSYNMVFECSQGHFIRVLYFANINCLHFFFIPKGYDFGVYFHLFKIPPYSSLEDQSICTYN